MEAIKQVTNRTITTCRIWCQILPISIFSTSSHLYSSFQRLVGIFSDTNLSFPSAIHTVVQFDFIRLILAGVNNSNLHSIFLNTSYLQLQFSIANFTSEKSIRPFLTVFITKFTSATRFLPFFLCSALSGSSVSPIFYCGWEVRPASPSPPTNLSQDTTERCHLLEIASHLISYMQTMRDNRDVGKS